jgi:hypothetical protein
MLPSGLFPSSRCWALWRRPTCQEFSGRLSAARAGHVRDQCRKIGLWKSRPRAGRQELHFSLSSGAAFAKRVRAGIIADKRSMRCLTRRRYSQP